MKTSDSWIQNLTRKIKELFINLAKDNSLVLFDKLRRKISKLIKKPIINEKKQVDFQEEQHTCVHCGVFRNGHVFMCNLGILVKIMDLWKNPKTKIPRMRCAFWGFWTYRNRYSMRRGNPLIVDLELMNDWN